MNVPNCPIPVKPKLGMCLIKTSVGLFFLIFGLMKLGGAISGDAGMANMIASIVPVSGILLTLLLWLVILTEVVGGLIVMASKKLPIPKIFYSLSLLGFMAITLVGTIAIHMGNVPQMLWHLMLVGILVGLLLTPNDCCKK
jgi:uncharacterized membrane protein YphA (DoxX/SURF4 family)